MHSLFLACCLLLVDNWPQFRGPNSDGHVLNCSSPLEWSDTKNVCWKVRIEGLGWSSPVVVDGKVYLTTAVPNASGLSLRAMAIDANTGEVVWDREVRTVDEVPAIHAKNSHASPTPIVSDGVVFVHFGALGITCLNANDGSVVWQNAEIDYPHVHGSGGSPILHDGKLVIVCDGSSNPFVAAIDAKTGQVVWKTVRSVQPRISHSFVTPTVTKLDGRWQVLAPGPDHFAAYDLETGEELWKVLAPGWSVVPQPALGHGMVFYNHDYDHPELIAAKLGGKGDVTEANIVWRIKRGAPSTPSPLLVGDELYFVSDNGIATCVDAKTGQVHWAERLGGDYSASPVFANDSVLFLSEAGVATWIQPGKEYQQVVQNELPGRTFATPAFAGDAMYLRTDEFLYKIAEPATAPVQSGARQQPSSRTKLASARQSLFTGEPQLLQESGAGEGPAWHPELGLLTSGDGDIHLRDKAGKTSIYREKAGSNGLMFDRRGRLVICEPMRRRVTRLELDGSTTVLAETFDNQYKFNQPNDLTIDSHDRIYFSDPQYGPRLGMELMDADGRAIEGVYRIDVDGLVTRVITHEVDRPNGLVVSHDDRYLFVADNNNSQGGARKLWRFELTKDGSVDTATQTLVYDWGTTRGPDGMKLDAEGRLYVAAGLNKPNPPHETADTPTAGIYVFAPSGDLLQFVSIPRDETTNCAFGGDDLKTLYVTAGGTLWSIPTATPGKPAWPSMP